MPARPDRSPRRLPRPDGPMFVTDGGLETDLIFHHGVDLPAFAAFVLLDDPAGRDLLTRYYDGYADVARRAGAGLLLEAPTWRANPDWGVELGYDAAALARVNADAVTFLAGLRERCTDIADVLVSGMLGPRADAYEQGRRMPVEEAADYHRPQLAAFAGAGADLAGALTIGDSGEAAGIALAARDVGLPVTISFTVETDGRLPGGEELGAAIAAVDAVAPPAYYLLNCAHPEHIARALTGSGSRRERVLGTRTNASTKSHAELDEAETLDEGDIVQLAAAQRELEARYLPGLRIRGGCCGTDARHVAALWGLC